ncbi:MarR family transcriptional regulator [Halobacteria archaeon AArc-m2/3/4]|uniref:MarR family transcriptional regulator n=1 Tax=Natronoglomus mannanivorans TaxID=2979990 RepID=A0ABT2Q8A3_9EURY|nr:MarR family transcriptional regulator [Halobacteria archaeon AArc-m2/3/4]
MRRRAGWMTQLDDEVLELLDSSGLVLSPSIIAYNLDRTREGVSQRLSLLVEHGLVVRVERGKYQITTEGEQYLAGELDADKL